MGRSLAEAVVFGARHGGPASPGVASHWPEVGPEVRRVRGRTPREEPGRCPESLSQPGTGVPRGKWGWATLGGWAAALGRRDLGGGPPQGWALGVTGGAWRRSELGACVCVWGTVFCSPGDSRVKERPIHRGHGLCPMALIFQDRHSHPASHLRERDAPVPGLLAHILQTTWSSGSL